MTPTIICAPISLSLSLSLSLCPPPFSLPPSRGEDPNRGASNARFRALPVPLWHKLIIRW
eukprot:COSAG03_NODE_29058_length_190_cov_11.467391_1_plen_59_part_01